MAQHKTGTVAVTNGSATVTGSGTAWLSNLQPGDGFTTPTTGVAYDIAQVVSATELKLSAPYAGASGSGLAYAAWRDFTAPDGIPEMSQGDIETATIFTRAMRRIQQRFGDFAGVVGLSSASIYTSAQDGIYGTGNGDYFFVISGNHYGLYRNNNGTEVLEYSFDTLSDLDGAVSKASALRDQAAGYKSETKSYKDKVETAHNNFFGVYYGCLDTDPAQDPTGAPPDDGDFYLHRPSGEVRFYSSGAWGAYGVLVADATKADEAEANAGVDDSKYMTPYKTAKAINARPDPVLMPLLFC